MGSLKEENGKRINAETMALVKALLEEKSRDISPEVQTVETLILATCDELMKSQRLRHSAEAWTLKNKLEALYIQQDLPRKNQMKREEQLRNNIKILNQPIVEKLISILFDDNTDLLARRSVVASKDNKYFDRITGAPMYEISHNLADIAVGSKKILDAIKSLRENMDSMCTNDLQKIYEEGHKVVDMKLKSESLIADEKGHGDLLATLKEEKPRSDELTGPEMVATASAEKMISTLESLKTHFQ